MRKTLIAFAVAAALTVPMLCDAKEQETYGSVVVDYVHHVYDGDTFFVDLKSMPPIIGDYIKIRVAGVDTPEYRAKCPSEKVLAKMAGDFTEQKLLNADRIILHDLRRGSFFRLVARVEIDGQWLDEMLISEGLGKSYDDSDRKSWCAK